MPAFCTTQRTKLWAWRGRLVAASEKSGEGLWWLGVDSLACDHLKSLPGVALFSLRMDITISFSCPALPVLSARHKAPDDMEKVQGKLWQHNATIIGNTEYRCSIRISMKKGEYIVTTVIMLIGEQVQQLSKEISKHDHLQN